MIQKNHVLTVTWKKNEKKKTCKTQSFERMKPECDGICGIRVRKSLVTEHKDLKTDECGTLERRVSVTTTPERRLEV